MALHPDFKDLLAAFAAAKVEYLIVGGYAVGFHAQPRFTKDIDIWIGDEPANLRRVRAALDDFGAPLQLVEALDSAGLKHQQQAPSTSTSSKHPAPAPAASTQQQHPAASTQQQHPATISAAGPVCLSACFACVEAVVVCSAVCGAQVAPPPA